MAVSPKLDACLFQPSKFLVGVAMCATVCWLLVAISSFGELWILVRVCSWSTLVTVYRGAVPGLFRDLNLGCRRASLKTSMSLADVLLLSLWIVLSPFLVVGPRLVAFLSRGWFIQSRSSLGSPSQFPAILASLALILVSFAVCLFG